MGTTTQGHPWGVKIHLYAGQMAGQMAQNPTKHIEQPYPSII